MFLKYPREVISISTSNINSSSKISVIKKSHNSSNRFVIKSTLSQSDIDHATEIYTPYGRFKLLVMNNNLYLQCEKRKSSYLTTTMNKKEYLSGSCILVSRHLNNRIQNYLIVLNILNEYEESFINSLLHKSNLQIKYMLSSCLSNINTCLELNDSLSNDPRTPDLILDNTNLNLISSLLSSTHQLFIKSYENKLNN